MSANAVLPVWKSLEVWKGHGTENDFIVIPDLDGELELRPEMVRALCDRRSGIGADGVLRVVRTEHSQARESAAQAPFFMDYHNADGTLAEMCGNGARVFVRYLQQAGLVTDSVVVATRGGLHPTTINDDGSITVEMGEPELLAAAPTVSVNGLPRSPVGIALTIPNPHVVVTVEAAVLDGLDLSRPPDVVPPRPQGQNVEFVVRTGARELAMRVHERGCGETRSCGTGICAAVVATAAQEGIERDGSVWNVEVPGGRCQVRWQSDGRVSLTGPAVLVAQIELSASWLESVLATLPVLL